MLDDKWYNDFGELDFNPMEGNPNFQITCRRCGSNDVMLFLGVFEDLAPEEEAWKEMYLQIECQNCKRASMLDLERVMEGIDFKKEVD